MSKTLLNELLDDYILNEVDPEDRDIDRAPAPGKLGAHITSAQAAKLLGVGMSRIRQMIAAKQLTSSKPEKGRRDHLLKRKDVQALKSNMPDVGRPEKDSQGKDD